MSDITFITCVYYDLDEEFNGRERREHYLHSLANILRTDAAFVIYTQSKNVDEVQRVVNISDNKRVTVNVNDLESLPIYKTLIPMKLTHELVTARCYEIMYSKVDWVGEVMFSNPFNTSYFFWIDAGLSHCGIFPMRLQRHPESKVWGDMYMNFSCFNPSLPEKLMRSASDGKLFAFCFDQTERPWSARPPAKYLKEPYKHLHMVGGLFGGQRQQMMWFCDTARGLTSQFLADDVLVVEEAIYSVIVNDYIDSFNYFRFNTWYHEDSDLKDSWNSALSYVSVFSDFFVY